MSKERISTNEGRKSAKEELVQTRRELERIRVRQMRDHLTEEQKEECTSWFQFFMIF